jgi:7-keto-8-aminopelargonate synthetase-like enzyme
VAFWARAAKAPSFEDLPGFEAIRLQQSLAGKIGIPVPFYRLHQAKAGTETVIEGRPCTNFTSYDYLGLNAHPRIVAAVAELRRNGAPVFRQAA